MVRGFCSRCGKQVGGPFKPKAWQCAKCRAVFCDDCPNEKIGWLSKKPVCPVCRIEMVEGGIAYAKQQ